MQTMSENQLRLSYGEIVSRMGKAVILRKESPLGRCGNHVEWSVAIESAYGSWTLIQIFNKRKDALIALDLYK